MSREKINSLDNSDSINEYQSVENVLIFSLTFCRMQLVGKGILVAATDKINRTTKVCIFLLKTGSFRVKNSGFFSREIPPPANGCVPAYCGFMDYCICIVWCE